ELLALLNIPFELKVPAVQEQLIPGEPPDAAPQRFSRLKAECVARETRAGIVLAADTIIVLQGQILGKPRDAEHARAMLCSLRGQRHLVLTGTTVLDAATGQQITSLCSSQVWMRYMDEAEIAAYVASGDPMDKAAAYAIQNAEFAPVERLVGCPTNVMGLPMCHVLRDLRRLGLDLPPTRCDMRPDGYLCALTEHVLSR
ncbi:MAG: septum formation protein Maf, partial [Delftia sp.]|nr:septum formation protein Maf [Delftia sp.]